MCWFLFIVFRLLFISVIDLELGIFSFVSKFNNVDLLDLDFLIMVKDFVLFIERLMVFRICNGCLGMGIDLLILWVCNMELELVDVGVVIDKIVVLKKFRELFY